MIKIIENILLKLAFIIGYIIGIICITFSEVLLAFLVLGIVWLLWIIPIHITLATIFIYLFLYLVVKFLYEIMYDV